ncbi:MAG: hypothetical protein HYV47_04070 [Candidatus Nealsonbacteria bacterium]|nr:hypothetical protein [Candidatus Nealsonbacteria bacterium]
MNADFFIILTPIIASSVLGWMVYAKNRDNLSNKVFGVLCLTIIFWASANYFSVHPVFLGDLLWIRMVMFFAVLLQFIFFLFVAVFPQNKISMPKWKLFLLALITALTALSALSQFLYPELEEKNGEILPVPGPLMPLFAFTIFLFWGLSAYFIFKNYRKSRDIEKVQWRYIFTGFIIMFLLLISSQFLAVVIFHKTGLVRFGPIFTLPFIILSAYAIVKHHLFDIKIIAAELFTAGILFFLLVRTLFSPDMGDIIFNAVILIIMGILSILLLKAVLKEIASREKIENLAENLRKTNLEIDRLSKAKTEFLSIASHQLRTPLTAVKGYVSLVLEEIYGKLNDKMKEILSRVYNSNERLIELINDLLNISRIESGKIELNYEILQIEDIIYDIIKELEIEIKKKNLYLKWDRPKIPLPKIYTDKDKIREAIFNIIDNAIKYTEMGGIEINHEVFNGILRLKIKDTGVGMDSEEISGIFKSFARGKTGTKIWTGGTGLGLYVAKRFVEMQNGKIWAESEGKDKGSTFYIELPLR